MKITHPVAINSASLLLSWWLRGLNSTLSVKSIYEAPAAHPLTSPRNNIYLFWHEHVMVPVARHARSYMSALVSAHRDGELVAQVMRMLGGSAVRGSTTRGGAAAIRELMRAGTLRHLAITPDGPRGPRRAVQQGALYLASRCAMPIVACGLGYSGAWRLRSWDRLVIPKPLSHVRIFLSDPFDVPPNVARDGLEPWRLRAQAAVDRAQAIADNPRHAAWRQRGQ